MAFVRVTKDEATRVATVSLAKPPLNALSLALWEELRQAFRALADDADVNVIILQGQGKHFTAGMDFQAFKDIMGGAAKHSCEGRKRLHVRKVVRWLQSCVTAIERCAKPVIASIHGACIGAGIDIVSACDIRVCAKDAFFSVKEIDLAITADVGTLQRLPHIVGHAHAMQLSLTGMRFDAAYAYRIGLVSNVYDANRLEEETRKLAEGIAKKSPIAAQGTKQALLCTRDASLETSLEHVAHYNAAVIISDDTKNALVGAITKKKPTFAKL